MSWLGVAFPSPSLFTRFMILVSAASYRVVDAIAAFVGTLRSLEIPEPIALVDAPATYVLE